MKPTKPLFGLAQIPTTRRMAVFAGGLGVVALTLTQHTRADDAWGNPSTGGSVNSELERGDPRDPFGHLGQDEVMGRDSPSPTGQDSANQEEPQTPDDTGSYIGGGDPRDPYGSNRTTGQTPQPPGYQYYAEPQIVPGQTYSSTPEQYSSPGQLSDPTQQYEKPQHPRTFLAFPTEGGFIVTPPIHSNGNGLKTIFVPQGCSQIADTARMFCSYLQPTYR